jgi:transposase-like protein
MAAQLGSRREYTDGDRRRLVGEIEARFKAGEGSIATIARDLGTCEASYHNWVKAGFTPSRAAFPVYSPERRAQLVALGQRLLDQGRSVTAASAELGLGRDTLGRWLRGSEPVEAHFRPVTIVEPPISADSQGGIQPVAGLVLVSPRGYRVEGLGVATAAELLRALA